MSNKQNNTYTNNNTNNTKIINFYIDCHCGEWEDSWSICFKLEEKEVNWLENWSRGYSFATSVFQGTAQECAEVLEHCNKNIPLEGRGTETPSGVSIYFDLIKRFRPDEFQGLEGWLTIG